MQPDEHDQQQTETLRYNEAGEYELNDQRVCLVWPRDS